MFDNINIHSSVAVYVQIENQVQFAVASGELKPGDRLPSIQEFAEKVGLNANTVVKAYRELEIMGVVYSRRGSGVFISQGAGAKCREDCRKRVVSRLHEVIAEAKASGMTEPEVKKICAASFASGASLYGDVPDEVLALAKKAKK